MKTRYLLPMAIIPLLLLVISLPHASAAVYGYGFTIEIKQGDTAAVQFVVSNDADVQQEVYIQDMQVPSFLHVKFEPAFPFILKPGEQRVVTMYVTALSSGKGEISVYVMLKPVEAGPVHVETGIRAYWFAEAGAPETTQHTVTLFELPEQGPMVILYQYVWLWLPVLLGFGTYMYFRRG